MRNLKGSLFAIVLLGACAETPRQQAAQVNEQPSGGGTPTSLPTRRIAYVPLTQSNSGTYYVDVQLANVCCFKMMLDTGASDVSVPISLWYAMLKDGAITKNDHFDVAHYRTANGVVEGIRFRMPPMRIAGITVHNVVGSVTKNDTGKSILLGQSFLKKFHAWQINNATNQLILAY